MTPHDAYLDLMGRAKAHAVLNSCSAVLGWDQQTYMPKAGAAFRGEQLALLAKLAHEQATEPIIGEHLAMVANSDVVNDPIAAANIRELKHSYERATKIPARLVEELARVTAHAHEVWADARATNSFATFQPSLEQVVKLKREEAAAVGYADHPYDALLDEYEPGATASQIRTLFADLSRSLVPFIQKLMASPKKPNRSILEREFPLDRQKLFAESAAAAIGFNFAAGRLDTTTHPFCSGFGPGDCRITTRYNLKFFNEAFFGVLHEAGHGLYEQNLPAERFGEPSAQFCSLGIHESQSRLWENLVGRSRPFWTHFYPRLQQMFPHMHEVSLDDFFFAINEVKPSFIRVEADEATYNLHIILRFEIELALMSGELPVSELPSAWNAKFTQMFNLTPPTDREGCLQDIHWSFGGIGYFPTYTLGNLYAAQLLAAAKRELAGFDDAMMRGDFAPLRNWLVTQIHKPARVQRASDLCARVTGSSVSIESFMQNLQEKFSSLYHVF
jgi:carboxypeptidase Taq